VKISVIVTVYNGEKYLLGCLQSIAAQTHTDFECLCVDDGSVDGGEAVIEAFAEKDARFRLFRKAAGESQSADNRGMDLATGDALVFVDQDDYIHPQMLAILVAVMEETGVDVVGCAFKHTDQTYAPMAADVAPYQTRIYDDPLRALLRHRTVLTAVWARLYKRSALQGLRFVAEQVFADMPFTVSLMVRLKRYAQVDAPLCFYYTNPDSTMRSHWTTQKTEGYVLCINAIHEAIAAHRPESLPEVRKRISNGRVKMIFNRIKKLPKPEQEALWQHAQPHLQRLYAQGRISYRGLKLKHKLTLWRLLRRHGKRDTGTPA